MLFSYTKSLMAGGIALLAVVFAGLWFQNRTLALRKLIQADNNLKKQISDGQLYSAATADYAKRLVALRADTKKIASRFVGQDYESPMLMRAIVEAASQAGMEMTDASKQDKKTSVIATQGKGLVFQMLSYAIILKGPYAALVKFLRNLSAWHISHKIESLEVAPAAERKVADEVEVALVLSVYAVDQPPK